VGRIRRPRGRVASADFSHDYCEALRNAVDLDRLGDAPPVVYDAMHGAGAGVLDAVLGPSLGDLRVLHAEATAVDGLRIRIEQGEELLKNLARQAPG